MTKHMTVQSTKSGPQTTTPAISGAPTFIPIPPRDPRLNDLATGGGAGNLGPAGQPVNVNRLPEGGGLSVTDEGDAS